MKPFYDASATRFWNPADVQYTKPFGYAYPETQRWLYSNDQAYQTAVRSQVTRQYGANVINNFFANIAPQAALAPVPSVTQNVKKMTISKGSLKEAVMHPIHAAQHIFAHEPAAAASNPTATADSGTTNTKSQTHEAKPAVDDVKATASAHPTTNPPASEPHSTTPEPLNVPAQFAHLVKDRTYTEWIVNLRTIKHALNQTFRVYVFLGDFNPDHTTWPTEHNVVGRFTVLGRSGATPCEKCQQDRDDELIVTGTVPLTSALLQDIVAGQVPSLESADVEAYLAKHLHWRVTVFDGSEVAREDVPGLKVAVVSTKVTIGADGLPVYSGVYEQHPSITDGRPAGLGAGDVV
jgi:tyrosinase